MLMIHKSVCSIIPPHMLEAIAENGTKHQKEAAKRSLNITHLMREARIKLITEIQPVTAGQKHRLIYDDQNQQNLPGKLVRTEGQPSNNDAEASEAYDGTGATYDLYFEQYQRNSIDDRGLDLISTVHYGKHYDNAFWDGQQMVYGDGDGQLFQRFTKPIDVTGHELTHGVTQYTANLNYQDQSGALNESFSDVFGSLVKQKSLNQTADTADWLIGAGIFTSRVHGMALRSMKAPGTAYNDPVLGKDPQPADMKDYNNMPDDNGGVHINSGIPNHAFYLTATGIGGNAWEKAGKIWYITLTEILKQDAQFSDCAKATYKAAVQLFGNGDEARAVKDAWEKVGIILNF